MRMRSFLELGMKERTDIGGMVAGPPKSTAQSKKKIPHDGTNCWRGLDSAREYVR